VVTLQKIAARTLDQVGFDLGASELAVVGGRPAVTRAN
jgi:hypothetical protein